MIIPPGFGHVLIPLTHENLARSAAITFGVDMNGQGGSSDLIDKITADFADAWAVTFDDQVTIGPGKLTVGQDGGDNLVFDGTISIPGENDGDVVSGNTALLVRKVSNRGGRRGRGRVFIPWVLGDGAVDDIGTVAPATVAAQQARAVTWLANLELDAGPILATPMVLLHSEGSSAAGLPNTVTGLVVDGTVASQRRRLGR